jgi:hypothetical protein
MRLTDSETRCRGDKAILGIRKAGSEGKEWLRILPAIPAFLIPIKRFAGFA